MKKRATDRAKIICAGIDPRIEGQAITLANAIIAMQDKIETQITFYSETDLYQEVIQNNGEPILKQNPISQEFRATVRDYSNLLNNLLKLVSENSKPTQISEMAELRKKFKIAK